MSRTVAEAIAAARERLNDEDSTGYRYVDTRLQSFAVDALNALRNIRPDLFIGNWGAISLASTGTALPINDQFFQPVVNYIVGVAELKDDEHVNSGRAQLMAQLTQGFLR